MGLSTTYQQKLPFILLSHLLEDNLLLNLIHELFSNKNRFIFELEFLELEPEFSIL